MMNAANAGFVGRMIEELGPQSVSEIPPEGSKGIQGLIRQVMLKANQQNPGSFTFSQPEEKIRNMVNNVGNRIFDRAAPQAPAQPYQGQPMKFAAPPPQMAQVETPMFSPATPRMGGVPSLGGRQDIAEKLANMGQYDDDEIAHVAEGEVIVPAPIMKYYPEIKEQVFQAIREEGLDPNEFVVGDEVVARNPYTGMQEFGWLSKTWKKIKKVVKKAAPIILAATGLYFAAPLIGGTTFAASGAGLGAKAAAIGKTIMSGALASPGLAGGIAGTAFGLGKGKNLKDSLKLGLKAGAVTGTLGNVFGTKGIASLTGDQALIDSAKPGLFSSAGKVAGDKVAEEVIEEGAEDIVEDQVEKNIFQKAAGSITKGFEKDAIGTTTNLAALGMIGTGLLTSPEEMPVGEEYEYEPTREGIPMAGLYYDPATGTYSNTPPTINVIQGPIRRVNAGGAVAGPGTGTSDSIPAMLSDGEFVMTAKAVRGMGDGSREKGAAKMYQLMNRLEGKA